MKYKSTYLAATVALLSIAAQSAHAAVVANVFTENFDDATLVAELTNVGSATISGGQVSLNGTTQGLSFDTTLVTTTDGAPEQFTSSWVMEAVVGTGTIQSSGATLDTLMTVNGGIILRTSGSNLTLNSAQSGNTSTTITGGVTALTVGDHLAIVQTLLGGTDTTQYYRNGSLVATVNKDYQDNFGTNVTSFFGNDPFATTRGFEISFDAVAFSTFTGTFDPNSDFAIPEPSALSLGLLGMVAWGFRRKRS